jgi:uncharacterized protein (DUF362 family)
MSMRTESRRNLLRHSFIGGLATVAGASFARKALAAAPPPTTQPAMQGRGGMRGGGRGPATPLEVTPAAPPAKVALTTGEDIADQTMRSLKFFEKEIAQAIGNKRIIIKPNCVDTRNQLAATRAETIEGILEFLKSINKLENAVVAESPASGRAAPGYSNYKYTPLADKYGIKLLELDDEPSEFMFVLNERTLQPDPVRIAKLLIDGNNNFVISAAKMKTHDRVTATLSLKNIVLGAPVKANGSSKGVVHGGNNNYTINYNLFALAPRLHPHLAVIEGYQGMQGNGPSAGTPVDSRVCVASMDWLAADRVGVELMGLEVTKIGYLTFATRAQLGQGDLSKIEVLGEKIADRAKSYTLPRGIEQQQTWMNIPPLRG